MNNLSNINEVNDIIQNDLVMVIAKSHNCGVCSTILNTLQHNVNNLDQIDIYSIYIDDVDEFRGQHTIFSVPTVLIFSNGKELLRESRYINYSKVQRLISLYNE